MHTHTIAHTHTHTHTHAHTHTQSFAMDTIVKSEIDSEDALVLKDAEGNLVLTLRFVLQFLQA